MTHGLINDKMMMMMMMMMMMKNGSVCKGKGLRKYYAMKTYPLLN
jgi:hypothetical protein